jgi:predicted transcriptional regulator YheO
MVKWFEIVQIAQNLSLNNEQDTLVWKFEANGLFSLKSMYVVINFRGVLPISVHSVWKMKAPPEDSFLFMVDCSQ